MSDDIKRVEAMNAEEKLDKPKKKKVGNGGPLAKIIMIIIVIIMLLAYSLIFKGGSTNLFGMQTDKSSYKAVFLTNGQVYFGKLTKETTDYLYIDDVYYIQVQDQVQPSTTEGGEPTTISVPTLMKRGTELHQPFGSLLISRAQVVAIENVGSESQVMQQIEQVSQQPQTQTQQ